MRKKSSAVESAVRYTDPSTPHSDSLLANRSATLSMNTECCSRELFPSLLARSGGSQLRIEVAILLADSLEAEVALRESPRPERRFAPYVGIRKQRLDGSSQRFVIVCRNEQGTIIAAKFDVSTNRGCDHRHAGRHRFQHHIRQALR